MNGVLLRIPWVPDQAEAKFGGVVFPANALAFGGLLNNDFQDFYGTRKTTYSGTG